MTLTHTTVASGAAAIAVDVHDPGPESASPAGTIVALHPGVGDRRFWRQCAEVWTAAGLRVVAHDRRGFGDTTWSAEPHDHVADLLAVMDAVVPPGEAGPVTLVGNSMGGLLALQAAIAHPDRVQRLVLIGAAGSGVPITAEEWPLTDAEDAQDQLIAAAEAAQDIDLLNRLEARYWLDGTEQPEGRVVGQARELFLSANGRALRAEEVGDEVEHPPTWPSLPHLSIPVMVVAGEHDLPGKVLSCRRAAEQIPGARWELMQGTAHCPQLDQPAAFAALVLDFVSS